MTTIQSLLSQSYALAMKHGHRKLAKEIRAVLDRPAPPVVVYKCTFRGGTMTDFMTPALLKEFGLSESYEKVVALVEKESQA
jgi:hypothetical protein